MPEVGSDRRREDTLLAKALESVCSEHLAPLISVVTSGVTSRKDVTEGGGDDMLRVLWVTLSVSQGRASESLPLVGVEVVG